MEPRALTCPHCGGRLEPGPDPRVRCAHCGTVSEVVGEGALRAARVLEQVGIKVPANPRTIEDIEQELADRQAVADEKRRTAIIMAVVVLVVVGLLATLAIVAG
jgi:hypothetical protein